MSDTSLNYASAGVDIDAGNQLVEKIKPFAKATQIPGVLSSIGGFGALFELPLNEYRQPVLVSSTDGVGTKLKLAIELNEHKNIGIDLVAMCVNDIITSGAKPLFFLDYFATGRLNVNHAADVIASIAKGCKIADCALVGGETAEMPGVYSNEDYDIAGFSVGLVEKGKILRPDTIKAGDQLIGFASSGAHSNGYSLIRKILQVHNIPLDLPFAGSTLGQVLLEPTRIYVKTILELLKRYPIKGIAHITGGGIVENLPRIMPNTVKAVINTNAWVQPELFQWLQKTGNIEASEMWRTFNCGVGLILVIPQTQVEDVLKHANTLGEIAFHMGEIQSRTSDENSIFGCG